MPNVNIADLTVHEVNSNVADFPKGEAVAVSVLPPCDICVHVKRMKKKNAERALFDGRTNVGSWANMCFDDFKVYGVGLGTGFGQRLVIPGLDKQEQDA